MRALTVNNVLQANFNTLSFEGEWLDAVGCPELAGTWFVFGGAKNGKTSLAMKLSRYLANFCKVAYDSVEEGLSLTIQNAVKRSGLEEVPANFILLNKEGVEELKSRLSKRRSPDVVFIDSIQFLDLKFSEYKDLKSSFPHKLFVYISHVDGKQPDGLTARKILRDANVILRVEGFRAFPVSRYGGGEYITISKEKSDAYWEV